MTSAARPYEFVDRLPAAHEHRFLCRAVGWEDHLDPAILDESLARSVRGSVALFHGDVIGMARLVGDGVHYFYVQDVVVHPDHEGNGLASELTSRLVEWVGEHATPPVFVGLFASPDAESVYESLGFSAAGMTGMHRIL